MLLGKTKLNSIETLISKALSWRLCFIKWCVKRISWYERSNQKFKKLQQLIKINQIFQSNCKTILSYCLKCKKKTESKNSRTAKTNKRKPMTLARRVVCSCKRSWYIKEQEAKELLDSTIGKLLINVQLLI